MSCQLMIGEGCALIAANKICIMQWFCVNIVLMAVKHGDLELDMFSNLVWDAFVQFLCT